MAPRAGTGRVRPRLLAGGLLLVAVLAGTVAAAGADPRPLLVRLAGDPVAGPALGVLVVAVLACLLVPRSALALAGGLAFGPARGAAAVLAGLLLAAAIGFPLGRRLGRDALARVPWLSTVDRVLAGRGAAGVALVRLLPLPPYGLANLVLGAGTARRRDLYAGTVLGAAPNTLGYAAAGGAVVSTGLAAGASAVLGAAGIVAGALVARTARRAARAG